MIAVITYPLLLLLNLIGATAGTLASWWASAKRTRSTHVYGTVAGRRRKLDLYLPDNVPPNAGWPVIVWTHGGAYAWGHRRNVPAGILAQLDRGYAVASVTYTFWPRASWPTPLAENRAAIRWIRTNADRFSLNPSIVFAAGDSAGGHLATYTGLSGADADAVRSDLATLEADITSSSPSAAVQGVLAWYPPTDMNAFEGDGPGERFWARRLRSKQVSIGVSPMANDRTPPFYLLHGTWDRVVRPAQSTILASAVTAAGGEATVETFDRFVHVDPRFNRTQAMAGAEAFLDRHRERLRSENRQAISPA